VYSAITFFFLFFLCFVFAAAIVVCQDTGRQLALPLCSCTKESTKAPLRIMFPYAETQIEHWSVLNFVNKLQDLLPVTVEALDRDALRFHVTSRAADLGFVIQRR